MHWHSSAAFNKTAADPPPPKRADHTEWVKSSQETGMAS
jgi:hypothetical protein